MSENSLKLFTSELIELIKEHASINVKGYHDIGSEYWMGRLFDSEEIEFDISELIKKYKSE